MGTITKQDLESVIKDTFSELYKISIEKSNSRLIFPKYRTEKTRISEQELRFLFIEKLKPILEKNDCYYSIETPTEDIYKFSEGKKPQKPKRLPKDTNTEETMGYQSAAFDLVIHCNNIDKNEERVAIIEFKTKGNMHEYAKDICKLGNKNEGGESTLRYFIIVVNKIAYSKKEKKDTKQSLKERFSFENKQIDFEEFKEDAEINVICYSLEEGKGNGNGKFVDIVPDKPDNTKLNLHSITF